MITMGDSEDARRAEGIQKTTFLTGYVRGVPCKIQAVEVEPGKYLERNAARAFEQMRAAADVDGITLKLNSAWRSYEHQQRLVAQWHSQVDIWEKLPVDKRGPKPPAPAPAGYSNHHMGVSVDINRSHDDAVDGKVDGVGPTDRWLRASAATFGFVNDVRGEPWHWTYRGNANV